MKLKSVTFIDSTFRNCYFDDVTSVGSVFRNCTFIDAFFFNTGEMFGLKILKPSLIWVQSWNSLSTLVYSFKFSDLLGKIAFG